MNRVYILTIILLHSLITGCSDETKNEAKNIENTDTESSAPSQPDYTEQYQEAANKVSNSVNNNFAVFKIEFEEKKDLIYRIAAANGRLSSSGTYNEIKVQFDKKLTDMFTLILKDFDQIYSTGFLQDNVINEELTIFEVDLLSYSLNVYSRATAIDKSRLDELYNNLEEVIQLQLKILRSDLQSYGII